MNMRPIYKKILVGFLIILGICILAIIAIVANTAYKNYKEKQAVAKWEETLRKPYKEDIYGGKTPEETWQMFLDALKKEDIKLASKYFAVEKQIEWKTELSKIKEENKLEEWIKRLDTLEKDKDTTLIRDKAYYSYKYFNEEFQRELWSSVVFYFNPLTKVWKILVL